MLLDLLFINLNYQFIVSNSPLHNRKISSGVSSPGIKKFDESSNSGKINDFKANLSPLKTGMYISILSLIH